MKLLFDQNQSPNLKEVLRDIFPGSIDIYSAGLEDAPDDMIWDYAKRYAFAIVSNDKGFGRRSREFGYPPKVILVPGNHTKEQIARVLSQRRGEVLAFHKNEQRGVLDLRRVPA